MKPAEQSKKTNQRVRVLYLEDSLLDLELFEENLRVAGLEVETTHANKADAYESALRDRRFDMILCDCNLPEYDGFSALKLARQRCPDTPVLMISGSVSEEEIVQGLQLGATDYILKQRLERLAPAIKRALAEVEALRRARVAEA